MNSKRDREKESIENEKRMRERRCRNQELRLPFILTDVWFYQLN